ncbi:MAG TPA: hypothetical protein EYP20_03320, partial [Aigarchaeota archaeon]|nr:hypothetical protein [Aigarchaeota archaeon]
MEGVMASVSGTVYYPGGPAEPGTSNVSSNVVEVRRLFVMARPLGALFNVSFLEASTSSYEVALVADEYEVIGVYTIERVDSEGNQLSFQCYIGSVEVSLEPGDVESADILTSYVEAGSLEECLGATGVEHDPEIAWYEPLIVVNAELLPRDFNYRRDVEVAYLPVVESPEGPLPPSLSAGSLVAVRTLASPSPALESEGVSTILVAESGPYVLVYLLDGGMQPARQPRDSVEVVYLGGEVTVVEVSPDGSRIYLGTSRGSVFMLLYDAVRGKYVLSRGIQVSVGAPVSSIVELEGGGHIMVSTEDGTVQVIRVEDWKPLWRGVPGFNGVVTGIPGLRLEGASFSPSVGYAPGSNAIYIFDPGGFDLNLILVNATIVTSRLDGSREASRLDGSTVYIL